MRVQEVQEYLVQQVYREVLELQDLQELQDLRVYLVVHIFMINPHQQLPGLLIII